MPELTHIDDMLRMPQHSGSASPLLSDGSIHLLRKLKALDTLPTDEQAQRSHYRQRTAVHLMDGVRGFAPWSDLLEAKLIQRVSPNDLFHYRIGDAGLAWLTAWDARPGQLADATAWAQAMRNQAVLIAEASAKLYLSSEPLDPALLYDLDLYTYIWRVRFTEDIRTQVALTASSDEAHNYGWSAQDTILERLRQSEQLITTLLGLTFAPPVVGSE